MDEGDPLGGILEQIVEAPTGTAEETVYTCLRHLAEEGIRDEQLNKPGVRTITVSKTRTDEVKDINECQHEVERVLLAQQGRPTENAWKALKSAVLSIRSNGKCPEGERAERLREIAELVAQDLSVHLTVSSALRDDGYWGGFLRELQADFPTPNPNPEQSATNAREKLMADLVVFETTHPNFGMRYGTKGSKEADDFTSRWIPRVFARVLLWLSALETCIKLGLGLTPTLYKKKTVQNAARRVLSRWYQWFAADGLENPVPRFEVGNETGGAPGEKRGAPVSVHGLGGTAGTGQEAKQRRTGGVNVGGFAASAAVPKDDIGDKGIPVLPGEAGDNADGTAGLTGLPDIPFSRSLDNPTAPPGAANSPGAGAEMDDIQHMLPEVH